MRGCVVPEKVTAVGDRPAKRGILRHPYANEEENGLHVGLAEDGENLRRVVRRTIVDRETDLPFFRAECPERSSPRGNAREKNRGEQSGMDEKHTSHADRPAEAPAGQDWCRVKREQQEPCAANAHLHLENCTSQPSRSAFGVSILRVMSGFELAPEMLLFPGMDTTVITNIVAPLASFAALIGLFLSSLRAVVSMSAGDREESLPK